MDFFMSPLEISRDFGWVIKLLTLTCSLNWKRVHKISNKKQNKKQKKFVEKWEKLKKKMFVKNGKNYIKKIVC